MKTIAYVSASARVAGAEESLLQLLAALDRGRWAPVVCLPGAGPLADRLDALDVPWFAAPVPRLRRTLNPLALAGMSARALRAAWTLRGEIKERGVDLVHAQGFSALAAAGPAARITGRPCLLHLRDLRYGRRVARLLCRFADRTIAISQAVADAAPVDCTVVPNGIDADAFEARARPGEFRRELGVGDDVPLVLVAAQIVPWKGHEFFLRAFARVRAERPDALACLAGQDMFGEHEGYLRRLRELCDQLGIAESVRWLGWRDDVPTLMADADVLAVPSQAEPFGRVALEAMAVGTPVVGRNLGGLPEVVEDGVTGFLARPDDAAEFAELSEFAELEEFAQLILRALTTGDDLSAAARRRVREQFSIEQHARGVCDVYLGLCVGQGKV